jgi:triacylglycerol lipase
MISRIQQTTTAGLVLLAAAWAWFFFDRGSPVLAFSGFLLILFGYALFLGCEFVLLRLFGGEAAISPARTGELFRAWCGEVMRTPAVFCWRQPFRAQAEPDLVRGDGVAGQRGVVLVHGFMCNRAFWNPWLKKLRARGVPFIAVSLEPPFGSIDGYADSVGVAMRRIESVTGQAPVVVAHSMGGLAVRTWLVKNAGAARRAHRVITIASPHRGTWLAHLFHAPNSLQMRRGSSWLADIAALESRTDRERFTCFYGRCDNIVFPISTATLPDADNRHLPGTAHVQMAFCDGVFDELLKWLDPVAGAAPAAAERASVHVASDAVASTSAGDSA